MKAVWFLMGFLALALGVIGIVLPLLPTVPFLLLAALCFGKSSERTHAWLTTHPTLGPPIQDWVNKGSINIRAKRMATIFIAAAFCMSLFLQVSAWVLSIQAIVLTCVLIFIWTRPSA